MSTSDSDDAIEIVDTPSNYRPDLSEFGIEEIDKGVCLDTAENRRILRKVRLEWRTIYNSNGEPSGNIEAISEDMVRRRSAVALEDKKSLLVDSQDPNSEYVSGIQLLLKDDNSLVPPWVIGATQTYRDIEKRRLENGGAKPVRPMLQSPPVRCRYIKSDNVRCQLWASGRADSDRLCRIHLGVKQLPGASIERARTRIIQSSPRMVEIIEELADSATSEPVRLKAASEMLDRAGLRGGIEIDQKVEIQVRPARDIILEKLAKLQAGERDLEERHQREITVDAEEEDKS